MPRKDAPARQPVARIVLVDANVFFAPRMRDLFMFLHDAELIYVHWTKKIEAEWVHNVVENHDADPQAIQNCLRGMRQAVPGWEVGGYKKYEEQFPLVDSKDRHVAAAAYKLSKDEWPSQEVALVTKNNVDFPHAAFASTQVTRYDMAAYIDALYAEEPQTVLKVVRACRAKLRNPKYTAQEYVEALVKHGSQDLAQAVATDWQVECPVLQKGALHYDADRQEAAKAAKKRASKKKVAR